MSDETRYLTPGQLRTEIEARCTTNVAVALLPSYDELVSRFEALGLEATRLRAENKALRGLRRLLPNEALRRGEREAALLYEVGALTAENVELRAANDALRTSART